MHVEKLEQVLCDGKDIAEIINEMDKNKRLGGSTTD
jgi:hypothetical protein